MFPELSFIPYCNDTLATISPRFIDMYNQALQSEYAGNIELAAIGYRASLEVLVKDFAINELHEPANNVEEKNYSMPLVNILINQI